VARSPQLLIPILIKLDDENPFFFFFEQILMRLSLLMKIVACFGTICE
jgi:hypothetical protein